VISAKTLDLYDGNLWGANYLIEGVIGTSPESFGSFSRAVRIEALVFARPIRRRS
jgi:hypothetical protein